MSTATAKRSAHVATVALSDRPIRVRVETPAGPLQLHADAKTGPSGFWGEGRRPVSIIPNAFGLPSGPVEIGGTCPQFSPNACLSCYAARMEGGPFGQFAEMVSRNLATLERLKEYGQGAVVDALTALVDRSTALQVASGVVSPSFRWLSSGDLFAPWFASAVRDVQRARPSVSFWGYTRSVRYLTNLFGRSSLPANARWFVSVDADNVGTHSVSAERYGLPVAYLAKDRAELALLRAVVDSVRGEKVTGLVCPASGVWADDDLGPSYVVGADGRRASLDHGPTVGACASCSACLPGSRVRDIAFLRHGGAGTSATWQRLQVRRGVSA